MKKKNSLLIDLTPLLDVILIILFLVLITGGQQAEQALTHAKEKHAQTEEELKEIITDQEEEFFKLNQEKTQLEERLNTYKEISEMSDTESKAFNIFMSETAIFLVNVPKSYPEAKLELTIDTDETTIKPADKTIQEWLSEKITQNNKDVKIIVLQYPGNEILWRDYKNIKQNIEQMKNQQIDFLFAEENTN